MRLDGWMDAWMDGYMDVCICASVHPSIESMHACTCISAYMYAHSFDLPQPSKVELVFSFVYLGEVPLVWRFVSRSFCV